LERLLNKLKGFVQEILRGLLLLPNKSWFVCLHSLWHRVQSSEL
jgi:hypothetical protein